MFIYFYISAAVLAAIELLVFMTFVRRREPVHALFFFGVLIANLGYLALALSQNVREAILANKITYIGAILPMLILLTFSDFCKTKPPRWLIGGLLIFSIVVFLLTFTIGYNNMYYEEVYLLKYRDVSYLGKTYGPWHNLYSILLYTDMAASTIVVVRAFLKQKNVATRTMLILLAGLLVTASVYFVERAMGIPVDLVPMAYVVVESIYLYAFYITRRYDMSSGILAVYENLQGYSYLSFDNQLAVQDYNDTALEFFPELAFIRIGSQIGPGRSRFHTEILSWMRELSKDFTLPHEKEFQLGKRYCRATVTRLTSQTRHIPVGYIVEVFDETARQDHLQQMMETMEKLQEAESLAKESAEQAIASEQAAKEAEARAVDANAAKSEFLANMSHEIRTPINAIIGMNEMIARESTEPQIQEYSGYVEQASHTLLSLINNILDFSKIEAGRMELVQTKYSLGAMLRNLYQMMNIQAQAKSLKLRFSVDQDIPDQLRGDEGKIRQVLINLISNSIKYTPQGGVLLKVSGLNRKEGKVSLYFQLTDTGIGMHEEEMSKLFQSFQRLDTEKNRNIEGTGLGMAITKRMTDLMGGTIHVESTYGAGSTFMVTIPQEVMGEQEIGNWQKQQSEAEHKNRDDFRAEGVRALVVDDNRVNLLVFEKLLKNSGMKITTALSGPEALEFLQHEPFDMIFLDHFMPEMDGLETLKKMKELPDHQCPDAPVIALTANAIEGSREMYLRAGFTDYLTKPIEFDKLAEMIEEYRKK